MGDFVVFVIVMIAFAYAGAVVTTFVYEGLRKLFRM